jgi:hypothetical protein
VPFIISQFICISFVISCIGLLINFIFIPIDKPVFSIIGDIVLLGLNGYYFISRIISPSGSDIDISARFHNFGQWTLGIVVSLICIAASIFVLSESSEGIYTIYYILMGLFSYGELALFLDNGENWFIGLQCTTLVAAIASLIVYIFMQNDFESNFFSSILGIGVIGVNIMVFYMIMKLY